MRIGKKVPVGTLTPISEVEFATKEQGNRIINSFKLTLRWGKKNKNTIYVL